MAVNLSSNNETGQNIKKQIEKERNTAFKIIRVLAVAATVALVASTGFGVYNNYEFIQSTALQIEQSEARYKALQDEAAAWHAENDKKINDLDEETGTVVSEIVLPSARAAGEEVAALQNKFYKDGFLLTAEKERFAELVKGAYGSTGQVWGGIGATLDPEKTSLEWEFSTWYDSSPNGSHNVPTKYDCVWTCWHRTDTAEYLVMALFAVYDSDTGMFTANNMYYSDFARMLRDNGAVEATGGSENPVDQEDLDELTEFLDGYDDQEGESQGTDAETEGEGEGEGGENVPPVDELEPPTDNTNSNGNAGSTSDPEQGDGNYGSAPGNA